MTETVSWVSENELPTGELTEGALLDVTLTVFREDEVVATVTVQAMYGDIIMGGMNLEPTGPNDTDD